MRSKHYQATRNELAEVEHVLEQTRKRSHGRLVNQILGRGNVVQSEQLSYVAFQKMFGRSTKVRAVGALMAQLQRKAESAGGEVVDLATWRLKLSQYDHCPTPIPRSRCHSGGTCWVMARVSCNAISIVHSWRPRWYERPSKMPSILVR